MRHKVLIYRDYGVSDLTNLTKALNTYFHSRQIKIDYTDAHAILKENALNENVLLFVMPGGAATPFLQKLHVQGNEKIRTYIEKGGAYLGICAGAYYACSKIEFEKDVPELTIIRQKELLNLVHATAIGTLHQELGILPYMKNEMAGAAVDLLWEDFEEHSAHYHGGPKFESQQEDYEVLARYKTIEGNPPAIIKKNYGSGRVVLSGVHFEDMGEDLQKTLHAFQIDYKKANEIAQVLSQKENSRKKLFEKIMASLEK